MAAKIDLNEADATDLASLPEISKELAAGIVNYRETIRPFTEIIELTAVPGISEQMVREIEAQVTVGDVVEPEEIVIVAEQIEDILEEEASEEEETSQEEVIEEGQTEEGIPEEGALEEDMVEEIESGVETAVFPVNTKTTVCQVMHQ